MKKIIPILILTAASLRAGDIEIVALTLLMEARGEGRGGIYRVACVIQQRQIERKISARTVCLQRNQFSCWNGKGVFARNSHLLKSKMAPYCLSLAKKLVKKENLDRKIVGFANHYCTLNVHNRWTRIGKLTSTYKNHKFFRL